MVVEDVRNGRTKDRHGGKEEIKRGIRTFPEEKEFATRSTMA